MSTISISLEKAKSAYISGNFLLCREYLEHLQNQISDFLTSDPFTFSKLDKKFGKMFNHLNKSEKNSKKKNHEKGLKLMKKLRKELEKLNKGEKIENLQYDQIMRREQVEKLLRERQLIEQNIFAPNFKVYYASEPNSNKQKEEINLKFYSHNTKKKDEKFVAVVKDEDGNYNGILSTETSDFNIVKHVDDTHLIYKEEKKYHCSVTPSFIERHENNIQLNAINCSSGKNGESAAQPSKQVKIWMETAYDVLQYFRSMKAENPKESMLNYVTTLFNIVKTIYANEQIDILLQGIYVWDIPDPFGARDSGDVLDKYQAYRNLPQNKWEGNLAHLLSFEHGKGSAIAFVDVLCARQYVYGFTWMQKHSSDIQNPSSKDPGTAPITSYSWNSSTIAHEMGHNFGSVHCFSCTWYRDGLANQSLGGASYVEGVCKVPPRNLPTGLTIMGYESNYPMTNGFGKQPGDVIRKRLAETNCIL